MSDGNRFTYLGVRVQIWGPYFGQWTWLAEIAEFEACRGDYKTRATARRAARRAIDGLHKALRGVR